MPFVKSQYKTIEDAKRDVQQDVIMFWHTVHDEVDLIHDHNIFEPLIRRVADIAYSKHIFDKLPGRYVNFLFDIEYSDDGSWVPNRSVEAFDIPYSREEAEYRKKYAEVLEGEVKTFNEEASKKGWAKIGIPFTRVNEDLLKRLSELPDGDTEVFVMTPKGIMVYERSVEVSIEDYEYFTGIEE